MNVRFVSSSFDLLVGEVIVFQVRRKECRCTDHRIVAKGSCNRSEELDQPDPRCAAGPGKAAHASGSGVQHCNEQRFAVSTAQVSSV